MAQQIGYVRVSTVSQNTERQLDGVELDRTFTDKLSGSTSERPQLAALLDHIRDGDTVHVHSIDRLARNLVDLMGLINSVNAKGASIKFHKENMHFTGGDDPMQRLMVQIMGSVAEFERSMINERAAEGRAIAKAKGVRFGRPSKLTPAEVKEIKHQRSEGKPVSKIAIDFDVSRPAIYRALEA